MAYMSTVATNIRQAVTSGQIASLNNVIIFDVNTYHQAHVTSYGNYTEVLADDAIPTDSKLFKALTQAFPNAASRSLPIYVGRIQANETILTPNIVENNKEYKFDIQVIDTDTQADSVAKVEVSYTSDPDATLAEITGGLVSALGSAGVTGTDVVVTDNGTELIVEAAANRQIVLTGTSSNLTQTFTTTTSAADAFAAVVAENLDDWYYVTTTVRDDAWCLGLMDLVDATEVTDYPKIMRISSNDPTTLVAMTDPANSNDLLGLMADKGYNNCFGEWHDQADEIFPEVAACVYYGGFFVGTQNWKFMNNCNVPVARHPVLGRKLTTAEQGFIMDRNAAVRAEEMKVPIYKVGITGDVAKGTGAWMDNLSISHWIRLNINLRVFNALVNAGNAGIPLTFQKKHLQIIKERGDSVLSEAVERNMLKSFVGVKVPTNISFEDQAQRLLKDLSFTGNFAGKVNYVIHDGILTYSEEV